MPYFKLDEPSIDLEKEINEYFLFYFNKITNESIEIYQNDLPEEMSNHFRKYGAINQFNHSYHYFKVKLGKTGEEKQESHRYRSQIINVYLERQFDLDFEIHHYSNQMDRFNKYDDKKVFIIYGNSKEEVKKIHQSFHKFIINSSKRERGELR
jgi:hypothetical protein